MEHKTSSLLEKFKNTNRSELPESVKKFLEKFKTNGTNPNNILTTYLRKMKWLTKLIEKVGMDKVAHFFGGATIALAITLILCFIGTTESAVSYSVIGVNAALIIGVAKELLDSEFNIKDMFATTLGGILAVIISLFSLL